jgi:hypothetical protein
MAGKKLGVKQRAVMITLMSEGRPLSNTEMKEAHGLVLDGEDRRQLNKLGYVVSTQTKGNAPYVHKLTEPGWRWCREELTAGRPRSSREESLGKALYAVLGGIARYLDHIEKGLADVFDVTPAESLDDRIRVIYQKLAKTPGVNVSLTDLRHELNGVPRTEVDDALLRLNLARDVTLAPQEDQRLLTRQDRAAALRVGIQDVHLLAIESS